MQFTFLFAFTLDDSAWYRVVFFSISSGKKTVVKQLRAGWLDMLDFVRPILKSLVLKLIYFDQLMGQDPS